MRIISDSPEETREWGRRVGYRLWPGAVVGLEGELGSGKTVFVQGLAQGLDIQETVNSPTFVLIQEYPRGRVPLFHVDAYRLECALELEFLGLDEILDQEGVTAVEWADSLAVLLPPDRLEVVFAAGGLGRPQRRILSFRARGRRYEQLMEELKPFVNPGS